MIDKGNFIDNFNDEYVSFIMGIGNNINVIFENDNVKNNKIIDFLSDFNDTRD